MSIILTDHTACELADQLSVLEDWLAHTESARDDLAWFAFSGCYRPTGAVEALIDDLGEYSLQLRRPPIGEASAAPQEDSADE